MSTQKEIDDLEVGEEFWDDETNLRMIKFNESQYAMVLDGNGNLIYKPQEH